MESRQVRFQIFLERLREAPAAQTFAEAFQQIADILNEVENEHSGIPFNPETWETDGRMYPPQLNSERHVVDHLRVRRFRSRAHNTFLGDNGLIEIQDVIAGTVVFHKPGADQRSVWSQ